MAANARRKAAVASSCHASTHWRWDALPWSYTPTRGGHYALRPGIPKTFKEQAKQLLEAAKESRLEALLTLAVATGMRRGELIGLRWADLDFEQKILWVRHTVNRAGKAGIIENAPKTEKSKRKILLPAFVLDALERHRERQAEMRREAGTAWKEQDIVFSNTLGGFTEASNFELRYKKLLQKAGLPNIRFHDLRHSAATILLEMNINPKQVQELLGHSSIIIKMDRYSHVLPSMQREMMDKLNDLFGEE